MDYIYPLQDPENNKLKIFRNEKSDSGEMQTFDHQKKIFGTFDILFRPKFLKELDGSETPVCKFKKYWCVQNVKSMSISLLYKPLKCCLEQRRMNSVLLTIKEISDK